MFGIGLPELIVIMAVALIVVGPEKLPGLAKTLAKQFIELKRAANSFKDSIQEETTSATSAVSADTPWRQVTAAEYLPESLLVEASDGKEAVAPASAQPPGAGAAEEASGVASDSKTDHPSSPA
jgi:sec-independent protein translocase protein TatB